MARLRATTWYLVASALTALAVAGALAAPFAYVPDDRQKLNVIDLATNAIVTRITVESTAIGVAAAASGKRVYVSDFATNTLQVIDTSTNATIATLDVCAGPFVPALNPAGTRLVVPCAGNLFGTSSDVMVIDTTTLAKTTIAADRNPQNAVWDATGSRFYVTSTESVSIFDGATLSKIASFAVPPGAFGTALNRAGTRLYVASADVVTGLGANVVTTVDLATRQTVATANMPSAPNWIAIDAADTVYVTLPESDQVAVLGASGQVNSMLSFPAGSRPQSVGVDGSRVYVQLFKAGTLAVLQAPAYTQVASVVYGDRGATWGNFIGDGSSTVGPNAPGFVSGVWWNPSESGWGIALVKRRTNVFAAWFTYDANGNPTWHVSTCVMPTPQFCFGPLLQVAGTHFFDGFDARASTITETGALFLQFKDSGHATMQSQLAGDAQPRTVAIERQPIAQGGSLPSVNYTDLWWNPREPGWGVAITQQRATMFLAWFVYNNSQQPMWYVATCNVSAAGNTCSGPLYRTTGPPAGSSFDSSRVRAFEAGTITVTFTGPDDGTLTYTVDGVTGTKAITRQVF